MTQSHLLFLDPDNLKRFLLFCFILTVLVVERRTLYMLSKCSPVELQPNSLKKT